MATINSLVTHVYFLCDLILSTALHTLELSLPDQFKDWVKAILGWEMNNCNPRYELHELVLGIALVHQVFYCNLDDEDSCTLFCLFAKQLHTAVMTLDHHQPAERALAHTINWAHTILPLVSSGRLSLL
ncbi:hypothetical protein C8Q76DRAFT_694698 [Earliella scabrosa]|nr:hypothetical protein C8Q76DRAFT_694698 [Earliella scabrosa]